MPANRGAVTTGLAALLAASFMLGGCTAKEPAPEPSVPSGSAAREQWALEVAKQNHVSPRDADTIKVLASTVCKQIGNGDDLTNIARGIARIDKFSMLDAVPLVAISIYGYCPGHKQKWKDWDYNNGHTDLIVWLPPA